MKRLYGYEVSELLRGYRIRPLISDDSYALPSPSWVACTFARAWMWFLDHMRAGGYVEEAHDCDDFARLCAAYAQLCHRNTKRASGGLLFGEFWYHGADGGHALNVFIDPKSDPPLRFFEPQTGKIVRLSRDEIETCFHCRF